MSDKKALLELRTLACDASLLYVEDNIGMLKSSVAFFKKFFAAVQYATDGQKGLELFKKQKFDLVITDIQMPNLNGMEMIKKIKKISTKTKIIIVSAHNDVEYLHEAISLGVNEYLIKPIVIDDLSHTINKVLKQSIDEKNRDILNSQLNQIFNYQHNLILMFQAGEIVLANKNFLDFFNAENLEDFHEKNIDFGEQLLEH